MAELWNSFVQGLLQTTWLEAIAVLAGIASVFYSRKENVLVYPVGLINTIIYIYLSVKGQLFGEATVNFYYTVMSIYGWLLWLKKDEQHHAVLHISFSNRRQWLQQLGFFFLCYIVIYLALNYLQKEFAPGAIPAADAFASASAFTGMWLMTRKKVESWWWWIATNIASIPLYFVKGYVFTSVYYLVLLILAVSGLIEWRRKASINKLAD
ncbi:MAG TPA: nicotinamide riboside transporter PnuC [Chitinophagaceae bacterium]|nr:nicotinamide riboside transporter PnuC [Chitinophagaceae bacterium]